MVNPDACRRHHLRYPCPDAALAVGAFGIGRQRRGGRAWHRTQFVSRPSAVRRVPPKRVPRLVGHHPRPGLFDPIFQEYMQQAEEPGECFACHTTGYNAVTGQFVMAGVTCEACHGPYRSEHPGQSMAMAKSDQLCGTCHKSTVSEWRSSRHGQAGIACVACHEMHTQKTRTDITTDALCAGCHQETTQDQVHQTHKQSNVRCVDCHLARPSGDIGGAWRDTPSPATPLQ